MDKQSTVLCLNAIQVTEHNFDMNTDKTIEIAVHKCVIFNVYLLSI